MRRFIPLLVLLAIIFLWYRSRSSFEGGGIPKIIHQTAPADKSKWHPLWEACQKSWLEKFPGWEYKMWTDEDLDDFIKSKHPEFLDTYLGYPKNINRIDAARYYILFDYGGIYADMDFQCLKNFEDQIPSDKVSIAESHHDNEKFQNALMVSPKGHPFWKKVHEALEERKYIADVLTATGPIMISDVSDDDETVNALPFEKFCPKYGGTSSNSIKPTEMPPIQEGVYTRHLGTGSWI